MIPKTSHNVKVVVTILLADSVPHEGNMKILLRDLAQRRRYEVSEFDAYGRAPVMIIEGAAFRIERLEEKYVLWSRGPVNSEIVVSVNFTPILLFLYTSLGFHYRLRRVLVTMPTKYYFFHDYFK